MYVGKNFSLSSATLSFAERFSSVPIPDGTEEQQIKEHPNEY